jgi:hypothetical protein
MKYQRDADIFCLIFVLKPKHQCQSSFVAQTTQSGIIFAFWSRAILDGIF